MPSSLRSINPFTQQEVQTYSEDSKTEIDFKLATSVQAFQVWRRTSIQNRIKLISDLAKKLRARKEEFANLAAIEMGKPVEQGTAEIEKCAWLCDYFIENAPALLRDEAVKTDASQSYIHFAPLGSILGIMPWNFPYWQAFRFFVPALLAGNAILLKHASNVTGCALLMEQLFTELSPTKGLFQVLRLKGEKISELIRRHEICGVALTGSTEAGKIVAREAGASLKKCVLELGGSDPYIILEDANLELAAEICANSRLINSGQSCISAKRFIVVKSVQNDFEHFFKLKMASKKLGNPLETATQLGPLARSDLVKKVQEQVARSMELGAQLLWQQPEQRSLGQACFYPPSILAQVKKGMPAFDEEIFGPVAAILSADDEAHAIQLANDTSFGLGAAVFTSDMARGKRIARDELEAGSCFVNALVKSDPRLPFGGIKDSGYGRELGAFGIREFVNIKSVFVK